MTLPAYSPAEGQWLESAMIHGYVNAAGEKIPGLPGRRQAVRQAASAPTEVSLRDTSDADAKNELVLAALRHHGPIGTSDLHREMGGMSRTMVAEALYRLQNRGRAEYSGPSHAAIWVVVE